MAEAHRGALSSAFSATISAASQVIAWSFYLRQSISHAAMLAGGSATALSPLAWNMLALSR